MGYCPIIFGYESQIVEFARANADIWPEVEDKMRMLYSVPTVWSSQPFMALTARGPKLIGALKDPEIRKIAWERGANRAI